MCTKEIIMLKVSINSMQARSSCALGYLSRPHIYLWNGKNPAIEENSSTPTLHTSAGQPWYLISVSALKEYALIEV